MKISRSVFATLLLALAFVAFSSDVNAQTVPDSPLKILNKPHARPGNCSGSSGSVRVRATFDSSGKITSVSLVTSSGCNEFDENAIRAARRIKFRAAVKDGAAVTVSKLVEYTFRRY